MRMRVAVVAVVIAVAIVGAGILGFPASSPYLAVSAYSPEGAYSVRWVGTLRDEPFIGVMGGEPFLIKIESSYPVASAQLYFATSTGQLFCLDTPQLEFNCRYFTVYYGLIIAVYPGETLEFYSFWMKPSWRIQDKDLVPQEIPPLTKPKIEDEKLQSLIDEWWETIVIPMEKELGRLRDES